MFLYVLDNWHVKYYHDKNIFQAPWFSLFPSLARLVAYCLGKHFNETPKFTTRIAFQGEAVVVNGIATAIGGDSKDRGWCTAKVCWV